MDKESDISQYPLYAAGCYMKICHSAGYNIVTRYSSWVTSDTKNKLDHFPDNLGFQLIRDKSDTLRSQIVASTGKGENSAETGF